MVALLRLSRTSRTLVPQCRKCSSDTGGGDQPQKIKVKQISRGNWMASLETLRPLIRDAAFVAVDAEMAGVCSAPWRDSFEFDSSDVRFLKLKDSATRFPLLQFGVCPFTWDPLKSSFLAHPHNFYLFQRNELPTDDPSPEFLCQTSSLEFLAKHHFDFNTCFQQGISYLSRAQEIEALQKLLPSSEESDNTDFSTRSMGDLLFTERMKNWFAEWREDILNRRDSTEENVQRGNFSNFKTSFYKMRPAVVLDGYTPHQLRLVRLVVRKHFRSLVFVRTPALNNTWENRVVYTDSEEDKAYVLKEVQMDLRGRTESIVTSAVGFRHVIDLLSSQNKLIVGHNCILDIAHMYDKFVGPIPSTMVEFIKEVHNNFPNIIDTKHIMNASNEVRFLMKRMSKSLSSAFSYFCPTISSGGSDRSASDKDVNVEVQADDEGSSCFNSGAKHEAGYDAFMTGCVFAKLCVHLGVKLDQVLSTPSISNPLQSNEKLQPYLNHLYPTWNSGTLLDFTTGTEKPEIGTYNRKYPKVVFENIVLLWGFPSTLNSKYMKECIAKVFGPDSVVSVFFIDSSAALVQFKKEEFVKDFLVVKETLERREEDPVSILHPLSVIFGGGNTKAGDYSTYKDIIACNLSKVLFKDQADASGVTCKVDLEGGGRGERREYLSEG